MKISGKNTAHRKVLTYGERVVLMRLYNPETNQPAAGPTSGFSGVTLLIEDEPALLELAGYVLNKAGYSVMKAETISSAQSLWSKNKKQISLILTDISLPDGSGVDFARQVLAENPALAVIIMSGYMPELVEFAGHLSERIHLLQKPYTPSRLKEIVGSILPRSDS
jgi:two-component system, cell cycle sensor histidine kinase and response regulator CckA